VKTSFSSLILSFGSSRKTLVSDQCRNLNPVLTPTLNIRENSLTLDQSGISMSKLGQSWVGSSGCKLFCMLTCM